MLQRKIRRFRHRPKNRIYQRHPNNGQTSVRNNSFTNDQRNIFRPTQSAEKLFEKYSTLAKEALSIGDKTLSENYLQHADHFMRVVEDKNKNRIQNKAEDNITENKINSPKDATSPDNQNLEKDTTSPENQNIEKDKNNKNTE